MRRNVRRRQSSSATMESPSTLPRQRKSSKQSQLLILLIGVLLVLAIYLIIYPHSLHNLFVTTHVWAAHLSSVYNPTSLPSPITSTQLHPILLEEFDFPNPPMSPCVFQWFNFTESAEAATSDNLDMLVLVNPGSDMIHTRYNSVISSSSNYLEFKQGAQVYLSRCVSATPVPVLKLNSYSTLSPHCGFIGDPIVFGGREEGLVSVQWVTTCLSPETALVNWKTGESCKTHSIVVDLDHVVHRCRTVQTPLHYYIRLNSIETRVFSISTKESKDQVVFGVVSDSQSGAPVLRHNLLHLSSLPLDLLIHVGDVVQDRAEVPEWYRYWIAPFSEGGIGSSIPTVLSRGNHDNEYPVSYAYVDNPGSGAWFSFTRGHSRIIVLDSNINSDLQVSWLKQECSLPRPGIRYRLVFIHVPVFIEYWDPSTYAENELYSFILDKLFPVLQQCQVSLILSGHSHLYQRGEFQGIPIVITGGSGGELEADKVKDWGVYTVTEIVNHYLVITDTVKSMTVEAISSDQRLIDTFTLPSLQAAT